MNKTEKQQDIQDSQKVIGYTVAPEFIGLKHDELPEGLWQGQAFVARHRGAWIGASTTKRHAEVLCEMHSKGL